jgi:MFS family permease
VATLLLGPGLIAFAYSRSFWLSMVLMLVTGFGTMVQMAGTNTVLQTIVDEHKRGRVMSLYTMSFLGIAPFGSLLAGGWRGYSAHRWPWRLEACRASRRRPPSPSSCPSCAGRPADLRPHGHPARSGGSHAAASLTVPPED